MAENDCKSTIENYGSDELNTLVAKLRSTNDPRKKYEYLLWLAKKLPPLPEESFKESIKVKGCISQVYVLGELEKQKIVWRGYSDALITKGMLSFLIKGLDNLTPHDVISINPKFIGDTGLSSSLTPSRANGFLNIFLNMSNQAKSFL